MVSLYAMLRPAAYDSARATLSVTAADQVRVYLPSQMGSCPGLYAVQGAAPAGHAKLCA